MSDLPPDELIRRVTAAVRPDFPDWVLFVGGTYVILDEEAEKVAPRQGAIRRMKEFGPVAAGTPSADFSVMALSATDGWVVSGHGRGIYTYVHPSELRGAAPLDVEIGLLGRSKRHTDAEELEVVHINGS